MSADKDRQQDHAIDFDRLLTRYNGRMAKALYNMQSHNASDSPWVRVIAEEQLDYAFGCLDDILVKHIGLSAYLLKSDDPGFRT